MLPALTVSLLLLPPAVVVGSALPPSPLADPRPFAVPLLDHASSLGDAAAFERSATDELARVEARYGGGRQAALSKRDSTVDIRFDFLASQGYSVAIGIGTPAQTLQVVLDTGIADLWVTGSDQAGFPAVDRFYDAKASSTFTNLTAGYSTSFAEVSPLDGSSAPRVNGYVATDTVRLGGANASDRWLGVMRNSSVGGRPSAPISGQLGLGLGPQTAESAAGYNVSTPAWWEALAANWSAPMFGLRLVQFAANKDTLRAGRILRVAEKGGVANFGTLDSTMYTGDLNWLDLPAGSTRWQVEIDRLAINGVDVPIDWRSSASSGAKPRAAVDSGIRAIYVPERVADAFWQAVPGSEMYSLNGVPRSVYTFPCDSTFNATLTIGGLDYTLDARALSNGPPIDDDTGTTYTRCYGDLRGGPYLNDAEDTQWILGVSFLKTVYAAFDAGSKPKRVAFGRLASPGPVFLPTENGTYIEGPPPGSAGERRLGSTTGGLGLAAVAAVALGTALLR